MDRVRTVGEAAGDKIKFFTTEQAAAFLDYIEQPYTVKTKGHKRIDDTGKPYTVGDYERTKEVPEQLRVLFNLAIYAGLRKGELLALEWSDIDFDNDTISVTKAVTVVNGEQVTKCPKTKTSRRVVSIPHFLTQRLRALKAERIRYRLSLGDYWQGAEWVFIPEKRDSSKPYGDYTVYCSPKSEIYHTDWRCASYSAKRYHIFEVIAFARPCKKCATGFFPFDRIPEWYTQRPEIVDFGIVEENDQLDFQSLSTTIPE